MALQDEMLEAIKKNLPAEVGDVLRKELADGKDAREKLAIVKESFSAANDVIKQQSMEIDNLQKDLAVHEDLRTRTLAVEEKERNIKLTEAESKAKAAEEKASAIMELTRLVFRSPVYKEYLTKSVPVAVPGSGGSQGYVSSFTETEETTKKEGE